MGPDWPLELTRDHPVVRRNGGFHAHPSLGLEGSELSWAGRAWWTREAYSACRCSSNTEDVVVGNRPLWHSNPILAYRCLIPKASRGERGERANNGICNSIKGQCFQVLSVWCLLPAPMPLGNLGILEPQVQDSGLSWKPGVQWLRAWPLELSRLQPALALSLSSCVH